MAMALPRKPEPVYLMPMQVEGGLNLAVLAALAVERHEHDVRHLAQLQHPVAELAGALQLSRRADGARSGASRRFLCRPAAAGCRRCRQRTVPVLKSEKHIRQHDLVAVFDQSEAMLGAPDDTETLRSGTQAAAQYNYFHSDLPNIRPKLCFEQLINIPQHMPVANTYFPQKISA
jgi:hypothetical protein